MDFKSIFGYLPSAYQQPIIDNVLNGSNHLLINAKAGSGKTSTLKMLCKVIPSNAKILNLAFNKKIAEEMSEKIKQDNVECSTIHSRGFSTMKQKLSANGKFAKVVSPSYKRTEKFIERHCEEWNWLLPMETVESIKEKKDNVRALIDLIRLSLVNMENDVIEKLFLKGFFSTGASMSMEQLLNFMRKRMPQFDTNLEELCEKHDIVCADNEHFKAYQIVLEMLQEFVRHFDGGTIGKAADVDFTDMIFFPSVLNFFQYAKYDFILVDECQDLSVATLKLVQKYLKEAGRLVAVGDKNQSIYGFAGADSESFDKISKLPNMTAFPLSECYRCGHEIIGYVRLLGLDNEITAYKGNRKGQVQVNASFKEITDGDWVLCRVTLPLVKLCYELIAEGKGATVLGKDIGASIINLYKKCKGESIAAVVKFMQDELKKHYQKLCKMYPQLQPNQIMAFGSYESMSEKISIVELIIANNGTVRDKATLTAKIESIFQDNIKGGIVLSTVHKAKGAEADRVFIIENNLMPHKRATKDWQKVQEKNLQYVAYTRAKEYLGIVTDWTSQKVDELAFCLEEN